MGCLQCLWFQMALIDSSLVPTTWEKVSAICFWEGSANMKSKFYLRLRFIMNMYEDILVNRCNEYMDLCNLQCSYTYVRIHLLYIWYILPVSCGQIDLLSKSKCHQKQCYVVNLCFHSIEKGQFWRHLTKKNVVQPLLFN